MLTINLISTEQKKEIKLRHIYGYIKTAGLVLMIIVVAVTIILMVAKIILQKKFNGMVDQMTLVSNNNQSYINDVKAINKRLNFVDKVQGDFIPWSNLLESIAELTPADINFSYINLNSNDQTIKIKGNAQVRSSLLDFKDKMAALPYFINIEFPLKNILEKENIDFEINAKLNLKN